MDRLVEIKIKKETANILLCDNIGVRSVIWSTS